MPARPCATMPVTHRAGPPSVAQTPAPSGVDDNALEDHLWLVRRMSIGDLTARIDSIGRAFVVLVRP